MALSKEMQLFLAIMLPVVIISAIVLAVVRMKPATVSGRSFSYTVYVVDETDGKTYFFRYNTPLRWPATYEGRTLWPLYRCYECRETFTVHVGSESTQCPSCRSSSTGHYGPEEGESMEAEEIDFKDIELPPKDEGRPDDEPIL